jgi:hypothetical protein
VGGTVADGAATGAATASGAVADGAAAGGAVTDGVVNDAAAGVAAAFTGAIDDTAGEATGGAITGSAVADRVAIHGEATGGTVIGGVVDDCAVAGGKLTERLASNDRFPNGMGMAIDEEVQSDAVTGGMTVGDMVGFVATDARFGREDCVFRGSGGVR